MVSWVLHNYPDLKKDLQLGGQLDSILPPLENLCDFCCHVSLHWVAPVSGCAEPIFTSTIPRDHGGGPGEHTDGRHKELSIQIASVPAARQPSTLLTRVSHHRQGRAGQISFQYFEDTLQV